MSELDCRKARPFLQRFADGELAREDASSVRSHLLDCLSCRAIVGEVYATRRFFQDEPQHAVPVGFAGRVAALAFSGPSVDRESDRVLPFVRALAAVAAAVLLVAGAFLIRPPGWSRDGGIEVEAGVRGPSLDEKIERLRQERAKQSQPNGDAASSNSPRKP